jgi:hypothetical protein
MGISFDFDVNTGKISKTFMDGGKFAYKSTLDFKAFYKELHQLLYDKGFVDNTDAPLNKQKGELDNKALGSRPFNMYENKFIHIDLGTNIDFEMDWYAKRGSPLFGDEGKIEFTVNLANRFYQEVEVGEGLNKKKLQSGNWEFRNSFKYTNDHIAKKKKIFDKIPFISNKYLFEMYYFFQKKEIEHDLALVKRKYVDAINALIEKHFLNKHN